MGLRWLIQSLEGVFCLQPRRRLVARADKIGWLPRSRRIVIIYVNFDRRGMAQATAYSKIALFMASAGHTVVNYTSSN